MSRKDYNWPIPRELGHEWQTFRKTCGPAAGERGQAQRYFMERREDGDALEQLRAHHRAPVECCPCYICNGGAKRAFKQSGEIMSGTIAEASMSCSEARAHCIASNPLFDSGIGRDNRSYTPRWGG
jgi:hypothetical protein